MDEPVASIKLSFTSQPGAKRCEPLSIRHSTWHILHVIFYFSGVAFMDFGD